MLPALCAAVACGAFACSGRSPTTPEAEALWPTEAWRVSSPREQGLDPARLDALRSAVRTGDSGLHSLLIVRHGYLVSEDYFGGGGAEALTPMHSVTKSVVSTLVGIAIDQGKMEGMGTPIPRLLARGGAGTRHAASLAADPRKGAITAADLLTMRAGLRWEEGDAAYRRFYAADDPVEFVLSEEMAARPGASFNYDSASLSLLTEALRAAIGQDAIRYAARELFAPLGIKRYAWERDRTGRPIGGWGLELTPRDMAKIGYLFLRGGQWEGRQLLSRSWIEAATRAQVEHTGRPEGFGYGYLWWTCPRYGGYAALGLGGQLILVLPALDMVVAATAWTPDRGHSGIFALVDDYILKAVSTVDSES